MPPDNKPPTGKDEIPSSTSRKAAARPQEPALKCPRCDSSNTKFCYYNNYSLTQPRHFCKTCRRYWTRGGALRSVPIGGGCRKSKKMRSSPPFSGDSRDSNGSSTDIGGLKFFQGVSPAMDFQLNFPRLHSSPTTALFNHFSAFGVSSNTSAAISSTPCYNFDLSAANSPLIGFDFPENQEMGFRNSIASSIESLSSINQDLHWKMQKQRLAMLLPGDNQKNSNSVNSMEPDFRKPQPILFQNLEVPSKQESFGIKTPRKDGGGGVGNNLSTEWFFDNSYATPATSNGINGENSSGWTTGVQAWSDLSQYSSIP